MTRERGLAVQANAVRRVAARFGRDAVSLQARKDGVALGLEQVDAQIERRRLIEASRQFLDLVGIEPGAQRFIEPIREIETDGRRQIL